MKKFDNFFVLYDIYGRPILNNSWIIYYEKLKPFEVVKVYPSELEIIESFVGLSAKIKTMSTDKNLICISTNLISINSSGIDLDFLSYEQRDISEKDSCVFKRLQTRILKMEYFEKYYFIKKDIENYGN